MKCPTCHQQMQSVPAIYNSQTNTIDLNYFSDRYGFLTGRSQSLLAKSLSPPRKINVLFGPTTIKVISVYLLAVVVVNLFQSYYLIPISEDSFLVLKSQLFNVAIIAELFAIVRDYLVEIPVYKRRLSNWQNSYYCFNCNRIFKSSRN